MPRLRAIALTSLLALVALCGQSVGTAAAATTTSPSYYLALGDSLAVGIQPVGPDQLNPNVPTPDAYPFKVLPFLQRSTPGVKVAPVGCPGATATSVANGGTKYDAACYPTGLTQLQTALGFIASNRVSALTINLGSNDVIGNCETAAGIDGICAQKAIAQLPSTLGPILDALNAALPKNTPRAGGLYYDPFLGLYSLDAGQAKASLVLTNALNDTLRTIYRTHGFAVAQVGFTFRINDGRTVPPSPVPNNVLATCTLTWFCTTDPVTAGNIHPTAAGYAKIAEAFVWALRTWHR